MRTSVRKKNKTQNKTEQNRIRKRNETPIPVLFSAPYPALSCLIILTESCQPMVPLKNKAKNSVYYPKKSSFRSINLNLIEAAFIPQLKKASMRLRFLSLKLSHAIYSIFLGVKVRLICIVISIVRSVFFSCTTYNS